MLDDILFVKYGGLRTKNYPQGLTHFCNWYKDFHDIDLNGM